MIVANFGRKLYYAVHPLVFCQSAIKMKLKIIINSILQSLGYYICINNFSLGKCLSLGRRSKNIKLEPQTTSGRIFQDQNVVAMATTDRKGKLVFLNLPDFQTLLLGFYAVNFLCFWGNRVNIQGVSTGKAGRKSEHNFRRNSQFSFLTRTILTYV